MKRNGVCVLLSNTIFIGIACYIDFLINSKIECCVMHIRMIQCRP